MGFFHRVLRGMAIGGFVVYLIAWTVKLCGIRILVAAWVRSGRGCLSPLVWPTFAPVAFTGGSRGLAVGRPRRREVAGWPRSGRCWPPSSFAVPGSRSSTRHGEVPGR